MFVNKVVFFFVVYYNYLINMNGGAEMEDFCEKVKNKRRAFADKAYNTLCLSLIHI